MKTYNITNRVSKQAKSRIQGIIDTHNRYKKSFFFHPCSSANGRRSNEAKFAAANPSVKFLKGEDTIEVSMSYSESCNNVYYSINIRVNGVSKNITALKKLLK